MVYIIITFIAIVLFVLLLIILSFKRYSDNLNDKITVYYGLYLEYSGKYRDCMISRDCYADEVKRLQEKVDELTFGDKVIGSKYTDKSIKPDIIVKQGYVKCSIAVTSNNSCITSDKGIAKVLKRNNIEVLYVEENDIKLLKKDATASTMKGFIGFFRWQGFFKKALLY